MGGWTCIALVLAVYAVAARRLDRLSITAPIVMVAVGTVLGAGFLDVLPANVTTEAVRLVTELTLALILFADASTVQLRQAEGDVGVPLRLLGIGLPLTIGLGALARLPSTAVDFLGASRARRDHPCAHRRRPRCRGRDQRGRPTPDPTGPQHRERPQRRDRHPLRHRVPGHRGGRRGRTALGSERRRRTRSRRRLRHRHRLCGWTGRQAGELGQVDHATVQPTRRAQPRLLGVRRRGRVLGQRLRRRVRRRACVRCRHSR